MSKVRSQSLASSLGGHRAGAQWMARCPAHEDATPSLAIKETEDGVVLVHCFAGCSQGTVIAALRDRGLWRPGEEASPNARRFSGVSATRTGTEELRQRSSRALRPWHETRPARGTVVEGYLRARGISLPLPPTLRFHPQLRHRSGTTWPAMIGLVTGGGDNQPIGIHRTWLDRRGSAKAPIAPNKMMLGPCRGGAVRLAPISEPLMIGEGIETCLAAMQATGYAAWAALSTSGMRALQLPCVRDIIVLADGDAPGEAAALNAASRWRSEGRRVRIARPPSGFDFNDVLNNRDVAAGGDADER